MALFIALAGRRRPLVVPVAALGALAALWNVTNPDRSHGLSIDYWFHFALGCAVFYRCAARAHRVRLIIDAGLGRLMALSALASWGPGSGGRVLGPRVVYEELFVVSGFAPLFIAARRHDERVRRSAVGRALMVLGSISYSLYRTHQFNVRPARAVARALFPDG